MSSWALISSVNAFFAAATSSDSLSSRVSSSLFLSCVHIVFFRKKWQIFICVRGGKERKRRGARKKKKKIKGGKEERKGGKERRKGGKEERKKEREDMKIL